MDYNEIYIDVLKEISNIGSAHATTSLASLLKNVLKMKVPTVKVVKITDISTLLGDEEQLVAATLIGMKGDVSGIMMNLMDEPTTLKILKIILNKEETSLMNLDEVEKSLLQEIGNILTSAYVSALADLTNLKITPSIPNLAVDMAAAILSVPALQYSIDNDEILLIETQFYNDVDTLSGYYLMIPTEESFKKILTALGIPVNL